VRVVLTPLISRIPIIGGLQVYFTKEPRIRFDLNKITQILDLPVIHTKIHNTVMKIVNSKFLYPNAYSINLTQGINMSRLTVFRTEGVLRVHVVEGKNLVNKDFIGKSDPYVVMSVASIRVETPVVQNSLNPKWDFWTEFEIDCNSELKVEVFDKDEGSKDDFLGCTKLDIAEVVRTGQVDKVRFTNIESNLLTFMTAADAPSRRQTRYDPHPLVVVVAQFGLYRFGSGYK
jgi:Ca2+-dependent lipid-binding protein